MSGFNLRTIGSQAFLIDVLEDGGFRFAEFNETLCALIHVAPEAVRGRTPTECFGAAYADLVEPRYAHLVKTRRLYEYEEELVHSGETKWWRTTLLPIIDPVTGRIAQILGVPVDITTRKENEFAMLRDARLDPLTGIGNRRSFHYALEAAFAGAEATVRGFSVILIDVDHFKTVNDRHGHAAGDLVLMAFASRLRESAGPFDHVARIGGDEFALVLSADTQAKLDAIVDTLRSRLTDPVTFNERSLNVGASVGASLWRHGSTVEALLERADAAMYASKARRRQAA